MQNNNNVYSSPESSLEIEEALPEAFSEGVLTAGKLRFSAWLAIFMFILAIPSMAVEFMIGMDAGNEMYESLSLVLSVVNTVIWIYLLLVFKTFLNTRFDYYRANALIYILIVLSIWLEVIGQNMQGGMEELDTLTLVFFASIAVIGVFSIILGIKLIRMKVDYRGLSLFSWCAVLSGVFMASVILMILALPFGLLMDIALAMIFFAAAKERAAVVSADL